MQENIIVELYSKKQGYLFDLEIPLYITAVELVQSLNQSLNLGIQTERIVDCYLVAENPIALMKGDIPLSEYHLHNGTKIFL